MEGKGGESEEEVEEGEEEGEEEGRGGEVARLRLPRSPGKALRGALAVSFEGTDALAGAGSPEEGETGALRLLDPASA